MNKKILILALLAIAVILSGCVKEKVVLDELQVVACNAAHDNNNCGRLEDFGLVTANDCCLALEKCCLPLMTGRATLSDTQTTSTGDDGGSGGGTTSLSDIQITICNAASQNNRCDSLVELGVVTEQECCSELVLCCSNIVSTSDLKTALINAIKDFFTNPNPTLNINELKDLIMAYFSASGDTVDLSGIGNYSGEKLIDIYRKAKNIPLPTTCTDSDGGKNYYVKGETKVVGEHSGGEEGIDYCVVTYVDLSSNGYTTKQVDSCSGTNCYSTDHFCEGGNPFTSIAICPGGCKDGACLPTELKFSENCQDNDKLDYNTKSITYYKDDFGGIIGSEDACCDNCMTANSFSGKFIHEIYCENDKVVGRGENSFYQCPNGCQDGACINESYPSITDISGTKDFYSPFEIVYWTVKAIENDGTPASFEEGYYIQFYVYDVYTNQRVEQRQYNAEYSNGYWYIKFNAPEKESKYYTEVTLYCSRENTKCYNLYGHGPEWKKYVGFKVEKGTSTCADSDGGINYYTEGKGTGLYSDSKQIGVIWGEDPNKCSARGDDSLDYSIHYDCCLDSATNKQLNEAYCDEKGLLQAVGYTCPNGCKNGACIGEKVKEQVKCVFYNTDKEQKCYSEKGGCIATIQSPPTCMCAEGEGPCECPVNPRVVSCTVDVSGKKGEQVTWKSSCGGYAYTVMDGDSESAEFKCGETKCYDSDGGKNYYTPGIVVISNAEKYADKCVTPATNQDGRNFYAEKDGVYYMYNNFDYDSCSGDSCYIAEADCNGDGFAGFDVAKCPNGCKNGACISEEVKEQVKCVFYNTDKEQKCYSEKGECTATILNSPISCTCKGGTCECPPVNPRVISCTVDVSGKKGEQVTWKSSCGGYAYTVMDGNSESAEFKCGETKCYDSDGGKNYSVKGTISGYYQGREVRSAEDACLKSPTELSVVESSHYLGELYCEDSTNINYEVYECPNSLCINGACGYYYI